VVAGTDTLYISNHVKFGNVNGTVFTTNDNLTLMSRATGTASVGDQTNNGANTLNTFNGKVCVERYFEATRKWQLLSIPTNTTQTFKQSWQEGGTYPGTPDPKPGYGMTITNFIPALVVPGGFDHYSQGGHSVKTYNPATDTYTGIISTNDPIATDRGYYAYVRGDRSSTTVNSVMTSTILRTSGTLKQGTRPGMAVASSLFENVGNPYASAIDMRKINKPGIQDFFYVWDPHLGGAYGIGAYQTYSYDGTNYVAVPGGGTMPDNFIQSGNSFFVRGAAGGAVTFDETDKTPLNTLVNRINGQPEFLRANLGIGSGSNIIMADGILVDFDPQWSNAVDYNDALKLSNNSENVSSLRDNQMLAIERRNVVSTNDTIHLKLTGVRILNYQWSIVLSNMDTVGRTAFLVDKYLNTTTPLSLDGTTNYDFNIQNILGSWASDRFMIVFHQEGLGPVPVTITSVSANRNTDNSINVNWKVENEVNMTGYEVERSADGQHFNTVVGTKLPTSNTGGRAQYLQVDQQPLSLDNYYRIKANSIGGLIQYSPVVKVSPVKQAASISVYPNPVVDKTMQLRFVNQPKGQYIIHLTNAQGQTVYSFSMQLNNGTVTESIHLRKSVAAGSYQLAVTASDGTVTKQQLIIE
jgi:hypothetical protein